MFQFVVFFCFCFRCLCIFLFRVCVLWSVCVCVCVQARVRACGQRLGGLQNARAGYSDWIRKILRWGVLGLCQESAPKARALRTAAAARGLGGPSRAVGGALLALGGLPLPLGRLPAAAAPRIQSHRKGQPGQKPQRIQVPLCGTRRRCDHVGDCLKR